MTNEFLEYSKSKGNDLMTPRPGFVGLKEGCRWCLCVERWKEALMASETMGERVVPRYIHPNRKVWKYAAVKMLIY